MRQPVLALFVAHAVPGALCLDNGLATVPWMGWSAWEVFRCTTCEQDPHNCLSERLIKDTADAMVKGGFRDAGYKIVWIDDCWAVKERNATNGRLVPDPSRWPHGLKPVADYVHSLGMKLGLYGDIGTKTCEGYPGLGGRSSEELAADAEQMAEWGIDAFKVDGCNAVVADMKVTYPALGRALNATGRPMIYSCSWPDYERSNSVPVNFSLVAEHCNSWRIFWDVQAGQYAHTQAQRYDCANGVMEFWGSGSTMAAQQFSPFCPGDCKQHPKTVDHKAMVAAAGPGRWNDADMLPIGVTFTMNGEGKKVAVSAFTLDQAWSAFAMWAMLASPLMIGADMREMSTEFREVWLSEELIRVNQDPLGKQGVRIRGDATECQVWLRHLDNGNELYVVLFNNGLGSCAPPAREPAQFEGPFQHAYSDVDCLNAGNHPDKTVTQCEEICTSTPGCNAFNYGLPASGCTLRSCDRVHLGKPSWADPHTVSYFSSSATPPVENATMGFTWEEIGVPPECMMSTSELITGVYWGTLQGQLNVSLRPQASAAFRMHPHCHIPSPPPTPSI